MTDIEIKDIEIRKLTNQIFKILDGQSYLDGIAILNMVKSNLERMAVINHSETFDMSTVDLSTSDKVKILRPFTPTFIHTDDEVLNYWKRESSMLDMAGQILNQHLQRLRLPQN